MVYNYKSNANYIFSDPDPAESKPKHLKSTWPDPTQKPLNTPWPEPDSQRKKVSSNRPEPKCWLGLGKIGFPDPMKDTISSTAKKIAKLEYASIAEANTKYKIDRPFQEIYEEKKEKERSAVSSFYTTERGGGRKDMRKLQL